MKNIPWWTKLVGKVVFGYLLIAVVVFVWSWLTRDFLYVSLSNRFFIGGVISTLLGMGAGFGNWGNRADWRQLYAQSAGQAGLTERNNRMLTDIARTYEFLIITTVVGVASILTAVLFGQAA